MRTLMADDPRAELVDRIEAIRERWRRLVADVGEDRMERPGAMGDWTFKDLCSHLSAWRRRGTERLEAAGRGDLPPPAPWPDDLGEDETDAINAWIHEQTRDRPLSPVLVEADAAYADFIAAILALPIEVAAEMRRDWRDAALSDGHPYGHVGEHEPDVREWLAAVGDAASGRPA